MRSLEVMLGNLESNWILGDGFAQGVSMSELGLNAIVSAKAMRRRSRRGVVAVLAAVLMVVMVGMIAFSIDIGYLAVVRSQLQTAADSAALAGAGAMNLSSADVQAIAQQFASANSVSGRSIQLNANDIEYGNWDTSTRLFTPSASLGNAIRVTARTSSATGGETPLFFGGIFNMRSVAQQASAIATTNPRDICFVIDLSGSMHDDTNPTNTDGINSTYASEGYPTIGTELLNQVYQDFGFATTHPNEVSHCIGYTLGVATSKGDPLTQLTSRTGPLSKSTIAAQYRILSTDSSSTRKKKAYSYVIDNELRRSDNMPAVKPVPASSTNYNYWSVYLDSYYKQVGYESYMQYVMYYGREGQPDGTTYTPLSQYSPDCPWHSENTAGGSFLFPPREQPTHAARLALIAAIQVVKDRNKNIQDPNQQDWVSVVSFDKLTNNGGAMILKTLDSDYTGAMTACTRLQACYGNGPTTATEVGLSVAAAHLKPKSQGGQGRVATNKIIVLLTDGMPNLYATSASQITSYQQSHPSSYFYGGGDCPHDAALMQTSMMQGNHWYLYPVGVGLGCDYDFMDRLANMGSTADKNKQSPRGTGNPADYQARLTEIFQGIIVNPKLRLVQ